MEPAPAHVNLLTAAQAAIELQVTVRTLKRWRARKKGPPYTRLNGSTGEIRYSRKAIESYYEERASADKDDHEDYEPTVVRR